MAVTKTENDGQHPASHYLVVGDPEKVGTWHLRVKDADGKPDHGLMGAAKAALTVGYRGQKYDGADKADALDKLKALYQSEGMKWDTAAAKMSDVRFVIDLARVALSEVPNGLTRTPIAATGNWVKGGESFSITPQDFQQIYQNFQKLGTDGRAKNDIVVDYDHGTVDRDAAEAGDAPASGWLKAIVAPQPGDTLLYGDIEFTDRARAMIQAKEIKYISPEIFWAWPDKRTGEDQGTTITSLGLTNIPFLDELPAITLNDRGYTLAEPDKFQRPVVAAESPATGNTPQKEKTMKKVKVSAIKAGDNAGHLKISHPDLPADSDFYANKDDVAEALDDAEALDEKAGEKLSEATGLRGKRLSEQIPEIKERFALKTITLSDVPAKKDGPDKGAPDFAAFAPEAGHLVAAEVFAAKAKEEVLDEAIRDKKILPKERGFLRKMTLNDLREYLDARTGGVALDTREHGHGGNREPGDKDSAVKEHDAAVRKVLSEKRDGVKGYGDAMKVVARELPEIRKAYDAAVRADR